MQRTIFYKIFMSIIILVNLVIFVSKILSIEDDKFIVYEISNKILFEISGNIHLHC